MSSRLQKVKRLEERIAPSALGFPDRPYPAGATVPGAPSNVGASGSADVSSNVDGSVSSGGGHTQFGISGDVAVNTQANVHGIFVEGLGVVTIGANGVWIIR